MGLHLPLLLAPRLDQDLIDPWVGDLSAVPRDLAETTRLIAVSR